MGQVSVTINGRNYQVACDDGQESQLIKLANYVDQKVAYLADNIGQIGDNRLLLMASLMLADEVFEAQNKAEKTKAQGRPPADPAQDEGYKLVIQALENLSKRLSKLAESVQSA